MKRAFTLIEMLIVVALIATLMTIVFRLSSVSSTESKRNQTVVLLAKIENALSGYYAAYGNYPPVRLHNSRDIYQEADGHGVQSTGDVNENIWNWDAQKFLTDMAAGTGSSQQDEENAWLQVEAACRAQPFGTEYPFSTDEDLQDDIRQLRATLQENLSSGKFKNYPKPGTKQYEAAMAGFDALKDNLGRFSKAKTAVSWKEIQVFKFGVMSFLLPRYQMMMTGNRDLYNYFAQWTSNNGSISNPMNGQVFTPDQIRNINQKIADGTATAQDRAQVQSIPSDATCARWLPNLEEVCVGSRESVKYYGVTVSGCTSIFSISDDPNSAFPTFNIYSPDGESTRDQYILDSMTVLDGWGTELFYYSPSPHQSYQLWSAGENMRTFPPWISRSKLSAKANECVFAWTHDDIRGMNN